MDPETHAEYLRFVNCYSHKVNLARFLLREPYRVMYADPSSVLLDVQSWSGVAGIPIIVADVNSDGFIELLIQRIAIQGQRE